MTILLATSNAGKLASFRHLLADLDVRTVSPNEIELRLEVDETGTTFTENALIKARAYRDATGLPCLADDSGLSIDALEGAPGVYSARYGGFEHSPTAQNLLVLERMQGVAARAATFVSVLAFASPNGDDWVEDGRVEGEITHELRGFHGFGYDPIFLLPELRMTYAELDPAVKDTLSHRGKAMVAARTHLEKDARLLD